MSHWARSGRSFFRLDETPVCPLLGVAVPVEMHTGSDDIKANQLEAVARFLTIPSDDRQALYDPLFADYLDVRSATGEGPRISSSDEVWSFVRWQIVLVPQQGPTGNRFVFVHGDPAWEVEHGVELLFQNERLMHVGRAEGAFLGRFWEWLGRKAV